MELITSRLVLREFRPNDLDALFAIYGDAENRRYESVDLTLSQTQARLDMLLADQARTPKFSYTFAITIPPGDDVRGLVRLTLTNQAIREFEIGWSVCRADWGKGYAPEAALEVLGLAFNRLHAHRVVAFCHANNRASRRVMEKLGMRSEGLLRETRRLDETWWDECVYAILERDFAARPLI